MTSPQHSWTLGPLKRPSSNLKNKIRYDTYDKLQLVYIKFRLIFLQTQHSNIIRTRCLSWIKVSCDFTGLGVSGILCGFKLVLEGKSGKEIPESSRLELLEEFSANAFALSDAVDSTSGPLIRGGIVDLALLKSLLAIRQSVMKAKSLGVYRLFIITSINKFGSFKNPSAKITSLFKLHFRYRRIFLLVQMKEVISMNYNSNTSSWKSWRWMRLDLIFMMRDTYISLNLVPLTKFQQQWKKQNQIKYIRQNQIH